MTAVYFDLKTVNLKKHFFSYLDNKKKQLTFSLCIVVSDFSFGGPDLLLLRMIQVTMITMTTRRTPPTTPPTIGAVESEKK